MSDGLDILAIGAHPDDVEMTSGGLLAKYAKMGKRTGILHLTKGEMGTRGTPEQRVEEASEAAKILGALTLDFAGLMDGELEVNAESVKAVAEVIRRGKPSVIVSHYPTCHHPDHQAAAQIVWKAIHFASKAKYRCAGEPHNVGGLIHARYSFAFEPSFYVDISEVIETKMAAIACYGSQFKAETGEPQTRLSNPNFQEQLMARGLANGLAAGVLHAEEYASAGPLVLDDPLAIFNAQATFPTLLR